MTWMTVKFRDLVVGESGGMVDELECWIDGWNEKECCVLRVAYSAGERVRAIRVHGAHRRREGRDRGGVGVKLCLCGTESCVGGRVGGRGRWA